MKNKKINHSEKINLDSSKKCIAINEVAKKKNKQDEIFSFKKERILMHLKILIEKAKIKKQKIEESIIVLEEEILLIENSFKEKLTELNKIKKEIFQLKIKNKKLTLRRYSNLLGSNNFYLNKFFFLERSLKFSFFYYFRFFSENMLNDAISFDFESFSTFPVGVFYGSSTDEIDKRFAFKNEKIDDICNNAIYNDKLNLNRGNKSNSIDFEVEASVSHKIFFLSKEEIFGLDGKCTKFAKKKSIAEKFWNFLLNNLENLTYNH